MEKNGFLSGSERLTFLAPAYLFILASAVLTCSYMALGMYMAHPYRFGMAILCACFMASQLKHVRTVKDKRLFVLPVIMVGWFILLQVKRGLALSDLDEIGLFMSVYLFAFPLASLLQDGDKKKALKVFAGAYVAAAALLSLQGILLILDCIPALLTDEVYWTGGRLTAFWHPNIVACFLMVGIVFCTTFLAQAKSRRSKVAYFVLTVLMAVMLALTSCRTVIGITGGYFGSQLFFRLIRRGKKWFLPGIAAVALLSAVFYWGAMQLYQANCDLLIEKYTQQDAEETAPASETAAAETSEQAKASDGEMVISGVAAGEPVEAPEVQSPIEVDPETGEVKLTTYSPQGTLLGDLATLNNRSNIWAAAIKAIRETPSILLWGEQIPGVCVSRFSTFTFRHLHNAWMECLVAMGLVGGLLALLFTLHTAWNCAMVLIKRYQDPWKRNVAILALCLMAAALMEPYLFYTTFEYHVTNFLFFLCAGYLRYWREEDDRCVWDRLLRRVSPEKKPK